jgi:hypothetical protein
MSASVTIISKFPTNNRFCAFESVSSDGCCVCICSCCCFGGADGGTGGSNRGRATDFSSDKEDSERLVAIEDLDPGTAIPWAPKGNYFELIDFHHTTNPHFCGFWGPTLMKETENQKMG